MKYRWVVIVCVVLFAQHVVAQEDPCPEGRVLFYDDFGGNDPDDPPFYTGPTPHVVNFTNAGGEENMQEGSFVIAKQGIRRMIDDRPDDRNIWNYWCNIDDHTSPDDKTRGYMLEVDGRNVDAEQVFYSVTLENMSKYAGKKLSILTHVSTLLVNGSTEEINRLMQSYVPGYQACDFSDIGMYMTLFDAATNDTLYRNLLAMNRANYYWYTIKKSYKIPEGVSAIRFEMGLSSIGIYQLPNLEPVFEYYKNCLANDIAVDDIEIRVFYTELPSIIAPDTVCVGTKTILTTLYEDDGCLQQPISYQWFYSSDSLHWTPMPEGDKAELKLKILPSHAGWYKVTLFGNAELGETPRQITSEPFKLYVIEDCPPVQCADGVLLFREDFGGEDLIISDASAHEALYSTTIEDVCAGSDMSFIARVAAQRLLFRLVNPDTGEELAAYETGDLTEEDLPAGSSWHQVGMNYTVPEGVERIQLTIYNNSAGATSSDITIHDVEIRLCLEPVTIDAETPACRKKTAVLKALYDNYGILRSPEYRWLYSSDSVSWKILQTDASDNYIIPSTHKSEEGWYRVFVADAGNTGYPHCRTESEPFFLETTYCNTAVSLSVDTAVCDSLLPYRWRKHVWKDIGAVVDTLYDIDDDDSIYLHLSLDTFHCEHLYPIIVNKYNWQLLCDNVTLRKLFPDYTPIAYQWYRDDVPIPGATNDDYSEQNELHGSYQLVVKLSNKKKVWSNIIDILDTRVPSPVRVQIYDSRGVPVREDQVRHGIYLYRYEQDDHVWTEKKLIP